MTNPFEVIENRLTSIENLLLDLKQKPIEVGIQNEAEKLLNIQEAAEFLNLTVPTMYSKVSKNEIPFMKRSKRLYFSSVQLMEYIKEGRKKSNAEIEAEAEAYLSNNKKRLNNGK